MNFQKFKESYGEGILFVRHLVCKYLSVLRDGLMVGLKL